MRYSVYNYDTKVYDYFEGRGHAGTHATPPRIPRPLSDLGASPEQAAWPLPIGARKVGSGELPQGSIASMGVTDDSPSGIMRWGILAVIAYLGWRAIR
jgi:hypothetical protein